MSTLRDMILVAFEKKKQQVEYAIKCLLCHVPLGSVETNLSVMLLKCCLSFV